MFWVTFFRDRTSVTVQEFYLNLNRYAQFGAGHFIEWDRFALLLKIVEFDYRISLYDGRDFVNALCDGIIKPSETPVDFSKVFPPNFE